MKYVQFFHKNLKGVPSPMLGSDGVMLIDQRLADHTITSSARTHAARLNAALGKGIIGFAIMRGSLSTSIPDNTPIIPL